MINPWRATAAALFAMLAGIGLARFAYAPLVPALVAEHWFTAAEAAWLGSANFAGYLAGALLAQPVAARVAPARVLRAMMLLAGLSFLACAHPAPFLWFAFWRVLSGISGGLIMVLAATLVLQHVPAHRRGLASGAIFTGMGLGVIVAAVAVPRLVAIGLPLAWEALGGLCILLAVLSWTSWPSDPAQRVVRERPRLTLEIIVVFLVYGLNSSGLVAHTMFLVDLAARELGYGIDAGAGLWLLFGIGALIGPVAAGRAGDCIGFRPVLLFMLVLQVAAIGVVWLTGNVWMLAASALIVGACSPGIAPVVLGRVRELVPGDPAGQRDLEPGHHRLRPRPGRRRLRPVRPAGQGRPLSAAVRHFGRRGRPRFRHQAHPGQRETDMSQDLLDLLNIELPIIQAPMAGISSPAMAAAVSNAGGLGSVALGNIDAAGARPMMAEVRDRTNRSYNVNLFCHAPAKADEDLETAWLEKLRPEFERFGAAPPKALTEIYKSFVEDDDMLAELLAARPQVVSLHFGLPPTEKVRALKQAGIVLLGSATSLAEARILVAAGIDAVVAQGYEAGGHRGVFDPEAPDERLGTFALTRLLARDLPVPVIAAGGIMDGAGIAAALRLGAGAAQLGTAFLACPESFADEGYRKALASAAAHRTIMTSAISGRPARCLSNGFTALTAGVAASEIPAYPIAYDAGKTLNAVAKKAGDTSFGAQWAGQGAPLSRPMPAADLIALLAAEMRNS